MATFNKFTKFAAQLASGAHNLATDDIRCFLTAETPLAADTVSGDIAGIAVAYGYAASAVGTGLSGTGLTVAATANDIQWTAVGVAFGPFQYVVIFNNTSADKNLIGWWDYGSSISCNAGESFTVDFDTTTGYLQVT